MFYRPGVARAVLQTPLSLIHSFSQPSFSSKSSKCLHSKTVIAMELKFWENVHRTLCVTCHVSHITCHVPLVTCHLSHVTFRVSHVTCHVSAVKCHMSHGTCRVSPVTWHMSTVFFFYKIRRPTLFSLWSNTFIIANLYKEWTNSDTACQWRFFFFWFFIGIVFVP